MKIKTKSPEGDLDYQSDSKEKVMRVLNDVNEILGVEEIVNLGATPGWQSGCYEEDNPDDFFVDFVEHTSDGIEVRTIGYYKLDGTKKTYKAALQNFNSICMKALETGYFKLSDFENFEIY